MVKDRIIDNLEHCRKNQNSKDCQSCEYSGRSFQICERLVDDILVLLKEQEAIKPDVDSEGTCTCRNCGETVGWYPAGCKIPVRLGKFCSECGQAVKWND